MRVAALCRLIARLQTVCQVLSTFKTLDTSHAVPRRNIISSKSSTECEWTPMSQKPGAQV